MAKLNRENIAMCILTTATYEEAAKKSGVSKATLYRLRQDPEFQEVIDKVKNEMFQDTMKKTQAYSMEALETLREIMKNSNATDSSRVSAASKILEIGTNTYSKQNESEEIIMKKSIDVQISAYLRLAELCGTGDDEKRDFYMKKVEELLMLKDKK